MRTTLTRVIRLLRRYPAMARLAMLGAGIALLGVVLLVIGAVTALVALVVVGILLLLAGIAAAGFAGLGIVTDARGQSPAKPPMALGRGSLAGYFRARRIRRIAEQVIRARSVVGRELIEPYLADRDAGDIARVLLARVVLLQNQLPGDHARVVDLYSEVVDRHGLDALPRPDQQFYVEALLGTGEHERADAVLASWKSKSPVEHRLAADALNPFTSAPGAAIDPWLEQVNLGVAAGIEPLRLTPGDAAPLDRVHADVLEGVSRRASVTVVISSWHPDETLFTAVRSALASTWQNLEVLVVDDASGSDYDDIYARVAAVDPRVVVHRMPGNGGTYAIRNHALDAATGDYLTFQDSDDWMHPRRLQVQAEHLEANPGIPANATTSVRVTDALQFSNNRSPFAKICEPSLMIRREAVRDRIGYFDHVRKNGDVEYRKRIEAAFGVQPPVIGDAPLTLQRVSADSLSNRDVGREWVNPARRAYMNAFRYWHLAPGAKTVPFDAPQPRPFFAPPELLGTSSAAEYAIIMVSNWLEAGDGPNPLEDEVVALADAGWSVAIAHTPEFTLSGARHSTMSRRIAELLRTGRIDLVQLESTVRTARVTISSPTLLPLLDASASGIAAELVVLTDGKPSAASSPSIPDRLFGAPIVVVPFGTATEAR